MSAEIDQLRNDMKRLKITEAAAVVEQKLIDAQVKEPSYQAFLSDLCNMRSKCERESSWKGFTNWLPSLNVRH